MTLFSRPLAAGFAALSLLAGAALAHHDGDVFSRAGMNVSHAYTFENADTAHSMRVYLTMHNTAAEADRLIGVRVPFARKVLFEGQAMSADGTLAVRELTGIAIAPGQTITLQPGSLWIELESVRRTFEHGDHFDMDLTFEKAGTIGIEVEVEALDEADHDEDTRRAPGS